jgi:nucleoid DNA-binding protein
MLFYSSLARTPASGTCNLTNLRGIYMPKLKKTRKAAPAKAVKKKAVKKLVTAPVSSTYTKSQIFSHIAEVTDLSRKEVADVFAALSNLAMRHLHKKGTGEFTLPGLAKCVVKHKPATKARKGINPFTGEEMMFKAKPARNVVKIRALKKLKEMAE